MKTLRATIPPRRRHAVLLPLWAVAFALLLGGCAPGGTPPEDPSAAAAVPSFEVAAQSSTPLPLASGSTSPSTFPLPSATPAPGPFSTAAPATSPDISSFDEPFRAIAYVYRSYRDMGTWEIVLSPMMDGNNWFGQIRDADSSPDEEAMFSAKAAYAEAFSRETVFCVYDGTKKIGEGRLASPTETEIYDDGYEVAFRAAFAMQGPTAATRGWTPGSYYLALPGDWNPFPSLIAWNNSKAAFTVDLDAQGHIAKGRIRLGPYSYCEADGTVVFPDREEDDELYPYIDVTYRGETKAYILGAADDMLTVIDGDLTKRVSFCDLDGDGLMEMHVTDVMPGGEIELIVSFQSGAQQIVDISYSE